MGPGPEGDPFEERELAQPSGQAHGGVELAEGDAEEGAHHRRVELHGRGPDQFPAGGVRRHGLLVGTRGRHHLEGVGDGDDPGAERDLAVAQATGVPAAVPPLVVLPDREGPLPEPRSQRHRQLLPFERVRLDQPPLARVERPRLVQHLGRDGDLAHVVEQGGPAQPVPVGGRQPHLLGQEVGVGPHPFRVPPGEPVVGGQGRHQLQGLARGLGWVAVVCSLAQALDPPRQMTGAGGAERHPEPGGCPVGKGQ